MWKLLMMFHFGSTYTAGLSYIYTRHISFIFCLPFPLPFDDFSLSQKRGGEGLWPSRSRGRGRVVEERPFAKDLSQKTFRGSKFLSSAERPNYVRRVFFSSQFSVGSVRRLAVFVSPKSNVRLERLSPDARADRPPVG